MLRSLLGCPNLFLDTNINSKNSFPISPPTRGKRFSQKIKLEIRKNMKTEFGFSNMILTHIDFHPIFITYINIFMYIYIYLSINLYISDILYSAMPCSGIQSYACWPAESVPDEHAICECYEGGTGCRCGWS